MKYFLSIIFFIGILTFVDAQEEEYGGTRLYYNSALYGGGIIHTNGWGFNIVKSKRITGFKKRLFSIEMTGMKHPKEDRRVNPADDNSKRYVYGKLNYFTVIRPAVGRQKIVFSKKTKRGVQISYNYLLGASIGVTRPVFLEIAYPSISRKADSTPTSLEAYNPDKHTTSMIVGRASYLKGIENLTIYPGVHAKFGLNFEYADEDNLIRGLETGIAFDGFYKKIPIMAFANNNQFFFTGYLSFQIGKKSIK